MDSVLVRAYDPYFKEFQDIELPSLNYENLLQEVSKAFKIPGGDAVVPLKILYNNVAVSNQEDLSAAYASALEGGDYLLTISVDYGFDVANSFIQAQDNKEEEEVNPPPTAAAIESSVVIDASSIVTNPRSHTSPSSSSDACSFIVLSSTQHFGCICAICQEEIFGPRFKCLNCEEDYDLCGNCENNDNKSHPLDHVFAKIRHPGDWENLQQIITARKTVNLMTSISLPGIDVAPVDRNMEMSSATITTLPSVVPSNENNSDEIMKLLDNSYIDWQLINQEKGKLLKNDIVTQKWCLNMRGGVHWPSDSLRMIVIKQLVSKNICNDKHPIIEKFMDSLECWSETNRDSATGQLFYETNCSVDFSHLTEANDLSLQQFSVSVHWHICTSAWPPRPLAPGMVTHFHVYLDSGKWIIDFYSPKNAINCPINEPEHAATTTTAATDAVISTIVDNSFRRSPTPVPTLPVENLVEPSGSQDVVESVPVVNDLSIPLQKTEIEDGSQKQTDPVVMDSSTSIATTGSASSSSTGGMLYFLGRFISSIAADPISGLGVDYDDSMDAPPSSSPPPPPPASSSTSATTTVTTTGSEVPPPPTALDLLFEMGFTNRDRNIFLLERYSHDISKVVSELITEQMSSQ